MNVSHVSDSVLHLGILWEKLLPHTGETEKLVYRHCLSSGVKFPI